MFKKLVKQIFKKKSGYDLSVGRNNRKNREEWLERKLKEIPPNLKILDAGAGEQQYKKFCSHLKYVSQDFGLFHGSSDSIGLHSSNNWDTKKNDIVSDITAIPLEDNSFDAIMCTEVFEHLPDPILAIKEFSRILKPNGILILTAPTISLTHQEPYYFYSGFSKYFYEKHLPDNGFTSMEIIENGNYFDFIAQELRRVNSVAAEFCNEKRTGKEIKATGIVLEMLARFSEKAGKAKYLTSYGYHIKAIKNNKTS